MDQGWAILQHEGPRWVLDVGERAGQVGQEANPQMTIRGLLKSLLDGLLTEKICLRASKLVQLETDDEAPDDVWPHLLERTC